MLSGSVKNQVTREVTTMESNGISIDVHSYKITFMLLQRYEKTQSEFIGRKSHYH